MNDEHAVALGVVMDGVYRKDTKARSITRYEIAKDYNPVYSRRQRQFYGNLAERNGN